MKVGRRPLLIIVAALIFLLLLDKVGFTNPIRNFVSTSFLTPLQIGWYRFSQGVVEKSLIISDIGSLGSKNLSLESENDRLKAQLAVLGQVQTENTTLKSQLGTPETAPYKLLEAQTLGFTPVVGKKELLLSEGTSSGVAVGMVVVNGNVVIGKISSVTSDRSTLQLLTDPSSQVLAITSAGAHGIVVGQFQSYLSLNEVLQSQKLSVGDKVLTSGEENWPKNLVIGEVTKVSTVNDGLFQQADVNPLVSYSNLQIVFIILGQR